MRFLLPREYKERCKRKEFLQLQTKIKTVSAQVVSILRQAIIHIEFLPGTRLPEKEIQRSLGISRSPIREAFRELQAEGLIAIIPNKGAFVTKLNEKDLEEVYELRTLIESHAIRRACETMTDDDLEEMRAIIEKEESAIGDEDPMYYLGASHKPHECFIKRCDNSRLQSLFKVLKNSIQAVHILTSSYKDRNFAIESVRCHREIFSALSRRDANQAEAALKKHLEMGLKKLTYLLKEQEKLALEEKSTNSEEQPGRGKSLGPR